MPTVLRSASFASACGAWSSGRVSPDQRVDVALLDQPGQLLVDHPEHRRVVLAVQPPVQADDAVVLDQQVVGRRLGDPAAGEADDDDPALERDALAGLVEDVAADRVVDDVGTVPAGHLLDDRDEVLGRVVDDVVGAELAAHLGLAGAAGRGDHLRAGGLGRAGSPRCPLPRRRRARAPSRRPGCSRGGAARRSRSGRSGRARRPSRRSAPRAPGRRRSASMSAYSAKAPGPAGRRPDDPLAGLHDLPAQLEAGRVRQRRLLLVEPLSHEDVGEVQCRRPHLDQHLARPGVGCSTSSRLRTFEGSPSSCTRHARMPATMPDARTAVTWWSEPFATRSPWR